jgi:hypothetical protein
MMVDFCDLEMFLVCWFAKMYQVEFDPLPLPFIKGLNLYNLLAYVILSRFFFYTPLHWHLDLIATKATATIGREINLTSTIRALLLLLKSLGRTEAEKKRIWESACSRNWMI